ncbi:MAG: fumarate hydratase [Candidatus Aureabacteria bacterium]|nr:fumarate hydratase [Candidatus Auribacterota bacterium]NLW93969.1 fumarate hydratase [Chlamydiota bacterium]HOE27451.1 fumarate hydratase [bacterium]HQM52706.1 fumarate hydratase [bacterium]
MRELKVAEITRAVRGLCIEANIVADEDVLAAFRERLKTETSPVGKEVLKTLLENARIAKEERLPICQDTGMAIVFLEVGQEVRLVGGDLEMAVHEGVRQGYKDGYLRKSVVKDPVERGNTGDNTPAVIHTRIVPGDKVRITVAPKGFGSENMSFVKMCTPTAGYEGIRQFVVECVKKAGGNPCPPVVVGVGVGGTFEKAALMAKQALTRKLGEKSPRPEIAKLEGELLEEINRTGVGPQGLGGSTTALAVHVDTYPTHIAGMPVAVNICCHAYRHGVVEL